MGGRGPRFTPGAVLLDPLLAQVVILEDDDGNLVLLAAVDQIGVDRETGSRLRYALAESTGIPYAAVIVNFSHTHSGPMASMAAYASLLPIPPALAAYAEERDHGLIRQHFPAGKIEVIADSGHNPHMDKREEFVRLVLG